MTLPKVSDANHWMKCPGSFQAQREYPRLPGEVPESVLEGRACHEVAQHWLTSPDTVVGWYSKFTGGPRVGDLSKDGVVITQELYDTASDYVREVCEYLNTNRIPLTELHVESRIDLSHIVPEWYGYADAWVYNPHTNTIVVWDFKAGHRLVEAVDNWSLVLYAEGIKMEHFPLLSPAPNFDLRIVQPRGFHHDGPVRTWQYTAEQHMALYFTVAAGVRAAIDDAPPCVVSSYCKTCSARAHCDTALRNAYESVDYVGQLVTHNLTGQSLGVELKLLRRAAAAIEARLSGLEEQAIHEIKSGQSVPFFAIKAGKGREKWRDDVPVDQVLMLGDLLGVDLRKPVQLDTPAQARKKGIDKSAIDQYTETPSTGFKLVENDGSLAATTFTQGNK